MMMNRQFLRLMETGNKKTGVRTVRRSPFSQSNQFCTLVVDCLLKMIVPAEFP
jgi:hypothetical protein